MIRKLKSGESRRSRRSRRKKNENLRVRLGYKTFVSFVAMSSCLGGLKPEPAADGEPEVVADKPVLFRSAVAEDRSGVPEEPITGVHAQECPGRHEHFDTAADVERKEGIAGTERARERRWEDQDARERLRRFAKRHEAGPPPRKRPYSTDADAQSHAEEALETTATERGRIRKDAGGDADLPLQSDEAGRV